MGLLLCTKTAEHPLYYEKLDIELWSIQELCYVICRYPVMIPEVLVDRKLCSWLREELGMERFAAKLEQLLGSGESQETMLIAVLMEGNYYSSTEISRFRSELKRLGSIEPAEFSELLGDTFFHMGRFGKAVKAYQEAADLGSGEAVLRKLATACVRVMQFDKAAELYEKVYQKEKDPQLLKKLYEISRLEPSVNRFRTYMDQVSEEELKTWEDGYEKVRTQVEESERVTEVRKMFAQEHEHGAEAETIQLIRSWKKEYREKV